MELVLVKEEVKVAAAASAFAMTKDYNEYVTRLERNQDGGYECNGEEESQEEEDRDRLLLKMTGFPVALNSICSENEKSEYSEKFAKRIERKLLPEGADEFGKLDLKLIISDRSNPQSDSLDGYFLISGVTNGSKTNILKQFKEEYNKMDDYCDPCLEFEIEVSLGYLPTGNAAVSPPSSSLIVLKAEEMDFRLHHNHVRNRYPVGVPAEVRAWWKQGTGFIYSKLTFKVSLCGGAVNRFYECSDDEQRKQDLLHGTTFKDVEISCKDGNVVKCHGNILARESGVFKNMLKDGKGGPWKLRMEMSQEGVKAFLGYLYCGYVSGGLGSCELALELYKVAPEYGVRGLREKMEEIMMAKGSSDFEYFSVKSVLDLFLYGRSVDSKHHLRDKAVRVLRNYLRTPSVEDQLLESEDYKKMLRDPLLGMEINTLYAQL